MDWQPTEHDRLSFSGDFDRGREHQTVNPLFTVPDTPFKADVVDVSGGFGMARWERTLRTSDIALQSSITSENRHEWLGSGKMQVADFDFQHHFNWKERNDIVWGAGYRVMHDSMQGPSPPFNPPSRTDQLMSVFLQDDVSIIPDKLVITLGSKFLHNSYTGLEVQPGIRMLWAPRAGQTWWVSVARAVRTPSRRDRDLILDFPVPYPTPIPVRSILTGNPNFKSETMIAYESGYRTQINRRVSLDIAAFVNVYDRLESAVTGAPRFDVSGGQISLIYPASFENSGSGHSFGLETSLAWTVNRRWKLQAGHALIDARLRGPDQVNDTFQSGIWLTPRNTFSVHSSLDLTRRWSFDSSLYYVSKIPGRTIPQYGRVDTRAAWKAGESLEFSAGMQNLQSDLHTEFSIEDYSQNSAVRRTAYLRLIWTF